MANRETINLGLDFRAIPLDVGDGKVWEFDPDPSAAVWDRLITLFRRLSEFQDFKEEDFDKFDLSELITEFRDAVADAMVDPAQKKEWVKRSYGLAAQQGVASTLMEQWSGFSTQPQSPSGKGRKQTG